MSTSTLSTIQTQLNRYGYPILMVFGNIGNMFIVMCFSRQRSNACSIYLLNLAIMNSLYLTFNGLAQIFPYNYDNGTMGAFVFCKTRLYLASVLGQIAKSVLVLACIDRFMLTSTRASLRAFSTPKHAKCLIAGIITFWFIVTIHASIMSAIINGQCILFGVYSTVFNFYMIIFIGIIPPGMLSIFGYLTYRHMKQMRARVQPTVRNTINGNISVRRQDRELLTIVLCEVLVYIITATPYPLILLETTISRYITQNKGVLYTQIESFITAVAVLLLLLNSVAPCYIYFIFSKRFRHDLRQFIIHTYQALIITPTTLIVSHANDQAFTQRDTHV